jgi:hypothetical protein
MTITCFDTFVRKPKSATFGSKGCAKPPTQKQKKQTENNSLQTAL